MPLIIARRQTADGATILLWDDGALTDATARYLPGTGPGRSPAALRAGWLAMGEVELCDREEIPRLVTVARALVRRDPTVTPGDLRKAMWAPKPVKVAQRRRCTACRYEVTGWRLCAHHEAEHQRAWRH